MSSGPTRVLYLAPWVDYGGSDSGTVDWFRQLDPSRCRASLITTQVSVNRRLNEITPHADEVWALPDILSGSELPAFILDFISSRQIDVVHIMNSRLGYQMIPDIKRLRDGPAVVVQFHLEEPDRSGYVRYVCTRYGNLVDAFSVVSDHLAEALQAYGVPRDRCEVIRLGIDADVFDADRVDPIALEPGPTHILYAGRLTAQKDPWLMLDIVEELRRRQAEIRVHCIGDGDLTEAVAEAVEARGLDGVVILHGPSSEMPRWYAACDLALMTSAYEGVPCVIYEAMAMALPLVVPALPGNAEVLDSSSAVLVAQRDDAAAYADELIELIADPGRRRSMGANARETVCRRFTAGEMGLRHMALYDRLTLGRSAAAAIPPPPPPPPPIRLRRRPPTEAPLVSVVVPCYNDGGFLVEALASVEAQTYPSIELIVVDDASTDRNTRLVLERLERTATVTVVRQPENRGPAAARNRALEIARGRYVLPLDADNVLVPDAIDTMVRQLRSAGELIGFVYPDQAFFGNRRDYHHAPAYNLHTLLAQNTCDTGSLIDREVFDSGVRFASDIRFGHEDWELFVTLAERDVRGEPARRMTMATRKAGFTRSDLVDRRREQFVSLLRTRHAGLYAAGAGLKARWSPAVSILQLAPIDTAGQRRGLAAAASSQTCVDAELIVRDRRSWRPDGRGIPVRTIHPELARNPAEALVHAAGAARGQIIVAVRGPGTDLLADGAFVEKLLRMFVRTEVVILTDTGDLTVPPLRVLDSHQSSTAPVLPLLDPALVRGLPPLAVAWRPRPAERLAGLRLSAGDDPLTELAAHLMDLIVEWRQAPPGARLYPTPRPEPGRRPPAGPAPVLGFAPPRTPAVAGERRARLACAPSLPGLPETERPEWHRMGRWHPPLTHQLFRHIEPASGRRVVSRRWEPPHGFVLDRELGWINHFPLCGTTRLLRDVDGFTTAPPGDADDPRTTLGYLEEVVFYGLDAVHVAFPDDGGPATLVAGEDDPLLATCRLGPYLGRIEPNQVRPFQRAPAQLEHALAALGEHRRTAEETRQRLDLTHRHAADLEERLNQLGGSVALRAYRRARATPGADWVARALRRRGRR